MDSRTLSSSSIVDLREKHLSHALSTSYSSRDAPALLPPDGFLGPLHVVRGKAQYLYALYDGDDEGNDSEASHAGGDDDSYEDADVDSVDRGFPTEAQAGSGRAHNDLGKRRRLVRFLDLVNNVCHVGHCNPRVTGAVCRQLTALQTNTRYLHSLIVRYAARLAALMPAPLEVVMVVNSGSEANDLARRLARAHTNSTNFICVDGAYHGNTCATMDLSPYKFNGRGGGGCPPDVRIVPLPDSYAGRHRGRLSDRRLGERYATFVTDAVANCTQDGGVAALFTESVYGCAGQVVPPAGYLAAAFKAVRDAGGVCVCDEVQVGFGRCGPWWGFQVRDEDCDDTDNGSAAKDEGGGGKDDNAPLIPDIVTLGKPAGNGFPLGAVVTTRAIAASFDGAGMEYFNTFGGSPAACAAGLAVIDAVERDGLRENARSIGRIIRRGLREVACDGWHRVRTMASGGVPVPAIGDVRGVGLFVGVEFVLVAAGSSPSLSAVSAALLAELEPDAAVTSGVSDAEHPAPPQPAPKVASAIVQNLRVCEFILTSTDGPRHNCMKIKPPLCVSEYDARCFVAAFRSAYDAVTASCIQ